MRENSKVMIVDDDKNITELIALYLNKEGYKTRQYNNSIEALNDFDNYLPDMIILDVMMPGIDGYEFCTQLRKKSSIPIIMLTAKGETLDKVVGLRLGADDYIVKPFEPQELIARIKAVFRRYVQKNDDQALVFPDLVINLKDYSVIYKKKKLELPHKEFELLYFIASNNNRVFTRDQILDKVWGYDFVGSTRTVDVHIKRLREKLKDNENWKIKTVWSVGYKFEVN
ncbi:response regulator transcription factor [Abyssisolibacter fermentans]|uniref:response regulator transcription factor n=1 Tax=Abyssisolibacter fermentans TaxID=1766203 RepID=UPI000831C05C|nr:response regulator transcription factor [Abyssisolibacter fermentans]